MKEFEDLHYQAVLETAVILQQGIWVQDFFLQFCDVVAKPMMLLHWLTSQERFNIKWLQVFRTCLNIFRTSLNSATKLKSESKKKKESMAKKI